MKYFIFFFTWIICISSFSVTQPKLTDGLIQLTEEAHNLHKRSILVDGHNDLPWEIREKYDSSFAKLNLKEAQPSLHTDIPRLRKGGVGAEFWSAYVPSESVKKKESLKIVLEQIDLIHRMVKQYPDEFEIAYTVKDIRRIHGFKIASMIGIEGGHAIENSLSVLRTLYALGARYLTLTHADTIDWADAATDDAKHGGLSPFGEEVVREMNRLGMLVDISHVSPETMKDVLRVSKAPVIASHSSAYAIAPHPRNVPDEVLTLLKANGGVVMVNFYSGFVDPEAVKITRQVFDVQRGFKIKFPKKKDFDKAVKKWRKDHPFPRGTVQTVVDHIDHIVKVAGINHVGLGSDFDGVPQLPHQLEDVSYFPYITQELLNRAYIEDDVKKILGENLLRALRETEEISKNLTSKEPMKNP